DVGTQARAERAAEQRESRHGIRRSAPASSRRTVCAGYAVPELYHRRRQFGSGGTDQFPAPFRAVELSLAVRAAGAALQPWCIVSELLHVVESDHQCAAIPQRRRRERK